MSVPRVTCLICLIGAAALGATRAAATEIHHFDVAIVLNVDSTFVVTETIEVDFGSQRKHGIFRTIPVDYNRSETIAGVPMTARYSIRLQVLKVTGREGRPIPFTTRKEGRNLFVRIGHPRRTVTGRVLYTITYGVQRAINRFDEHDELYWNVTGTEWDWPIHSASARIWFPSDVETERVMHKTFTGRWSSTTTDAKEQLIPELYFAEVANLGVGEGLTIVLGFPKGTLRPPSVSQESGGPLRTTLFSFSQPSPRFWCWQSCSGPIYELAETLDVEHRSSCNTSRRPSFRRRKSAAW